MIKKKYVFLFVCMFLFVAAVGEVNAKKRGSTGTGCADLQAAFSYPLTTLTSVAPQAAGPVTVNGIVYNMPEHCVVKGKMNERVGPIDNKPYAIGFEMRLPANWNGRFLYQANGGIDGNVVPAYGTDLGGGPKSNGLIRGFAVISSDAGHTSDGGQFGIDPQARLDYGYNAVAQLTPMAKSLIKTFYGKKPSKSYLYGCSNGGRHAMVAASRYADQYDGILAGNPGFNLPKAAISQIWGAQRYFTLTTPSTDIGSSFTPAEFSLVGGKILAKCDALDGLVDDMVSNPLACQTAFNLDADVPTCSGDRDGTCLTAAQKEVLADIMTGGSNSAGPLYINFLWDVGIKGSNWRFWDFIASTFLDPGAVGFIFTTPPQDPATFNGLEYALNLGSTGFDPDVDAPKIFATNGTYAESGMSFMTPPDLTMSGLFKHKSKLLVFHGVADAVFSSADTIKWYEDFLDTWRGRAQNTARLFLVPQMNHCSGGPSCDQFDMLDALVKWVEQGRVPNSIVAKARGAGANLVNAEVPATWAPDRTRLLCPYPKLAKYIGRGSIENAASFRCVPNVVPLKCKFKKCKFK